MYLPGAIEFYRNIPGDPWDQAHRDFEKAVDYSLTSGQSEGISHQAAAQFEATIKELIERYKPFAGGQISLPVNTAFMSNSVEQFEARDSVRTRKCAVCGTGDGIKIERHPVGGVGIYCAPCFSQASKNPVS